MKLLSFSITNFRSITNAHKVILHDYSILVGKNNEGKSNILKALNIAIKILQRRRTRARPRDENYYSEERDFPVSLQNIP